MIFSSIIYTEESSKLVRFTQSQFLATYLLIWIGLLTMIIYIV